MLKKLLYGAAIGVIGAIAGCWLFGPALTLAAGVGALAFGLFVLYQLVA